ncbi:MAG: sugar ABC transporter ATP-binding protein [Planctomycetes bacterium]|nr:sugar ABC transporter ATP-binding protein [Planctomycetota bacterium]MCC7171463.1 sugar ABC transporter ATP-binding protein [Planctomycetota bacterium]
MSKPPLLSMRDVAKRYGATQALRGVGFTIERGQVRALIGENGAGKSTLMKVLAGVVPPDAGSMQVEGRPYTPRSPHDARMARVAMIHQELAIAPDLSVADNVLLGGEHARFGVTAKREQYAIARAALTRLGRDDLDPAARAGDLGLAEQQLVEIARALVADARVLIFDEPTSSLGERDASHLFRVVGELKAQGLGIVWISHFLEEVQRVADVFTVLRDGAVVDDGVMAGTSLQRIVASMAGRAVDAMFPKVPHAIGDPVLTVDGLSGVRAPRDVTLVLRRGEILGIAGLVGAGRSEFLRCMFGIDRVHSGRARRSDGRAVGVSPRASLRAGLGFVSEDRKSEGLALDLSIEDNLTLSHLRPFARAGVLATSRRRATATALAARLGVKTTGVTQPIGALSGGNQQKVALARLLHEGGDVWLLDEPTRGIDVGTKAEIWRLIGEHAASGGTIVVVSSYLPELLNVCDRIAVFCKGELRAVRPAHEWTQEAVLHVATGAEVAMSARSDA